MPEYRETSKSFQKKRIALVGYGALGKALHSRLLAAGCENVTVYTSKPLPFAHVRRSEDSAAISAADFVWLCIPDDRIKLFSDSVAFSTETGSPLWIHCSGSQGLAPLLSLKRFNARIASVHFIQTFTNMSGLDVFEGVPASVLCENDSDFDELTGFTKSLLSASPFRVTENGKTKIHLAAVLISNFWIMLAGKANEFALEASGRSAADLFARLMAQTVANLTRDPQVSPLSSLSGPLKRGDIDTISKHIELLNDDPMLRQAYIAVSRVGLQQLKKTAEDKSFDFFQLERMINEGNG